MVKDPVCGMECEPKDAFATREHDGKTFYFCSPGCVKEFDANPHKYAHADEPKKSSEKTHSTHH